MSDLIANAITRLPKSDNLADDLAAINKRLAELDKQLENLTEAVALGGGQLRPLLQKMESLEATRLPLEMKQRELEQSIEVARRQQPDAERICKEWSRFTTLWEAATEDEREELMQALVVRVEMHEKE
ncbi:hypothetical protein CCAX7_42170 [Capsulimonas corticalis]|uniref:Uncharacterized protein n=1 Tax=Capsulimonas corticalis TaxID=2219043 RepID=A0A402CXT5_9BACT|nr:hypothetical protein [Capsulimonas corticalis]BDI32166.1 hypothetical protein CCAX7_42170 [Capsulimonas corticalis]